MMIRQRELGGQRALPHRSVMIRIICIAVLCKILFQNFMASIFSSKHFSEAKQEELRSKCVSILFMTFLLKALYDSDPRSFPRKIGAFAVAFVIVASCQALFNKYVFSD